MKRTSSSLLISILVATEDERIRRSPKRSLERRTFAGSQLVEMPALGRTESPPSIPRHSARCWRRCDGDAKVAAKMPFFLTGSRLIATGKYGLLFLTCHLGLGEHLGVFGSSVETKLVHVFPAWIHGAEADPGVPLRPKSASELAHPWPGQLSRLLPSPCSRLW